MAFFVTHHVFLKHDLLNEDEIGEGRREHQEESFPGLWRGGMTEEQYNRQWEQTERTEEGNLQELYLARPPVTLQKATVLVSGKICADCKGFVRQVESALGLKRCEAEHHLQA